MSFSVAPQRAARFPTCAFFKCMSCGHIDTVDADAPSE
jgi:hypothetical protein